MNIVEQSSRRFRPLAWLRDLWLIAGVVLLLLLLTDAVLNAWLPDHPGLAQVQAGARAPAPEHSDAMGTESWVEVYSQELRAARRTRWHPWTYWRRQPYSGKYINIDANGIRSSWAAPGAQANLWVMGGSTVWGTGARDDYTLPSQLARELTRRGLAVNVVNLGESGYVLGQDQIAALRGLETSPAPAAVAFYSGVNDVFAALQSGVAGESQNELHRRRDFRVTDGLDNWLAAFPDVLEGVKKLSIRFAPAKPEPPAIEALAQAVAQAYASRVSAVAAVFAQRDIPVLFFWQPSVFSRAAPRGDESTIVGASLAAHRDLQLATDRAVRALLNEQAGFHYLGAIFDAEAAPYFLDFCHLSEAGNEIVAKHMARQLVPLMNQLVRSD